MNRYIYISALINLVKSMFYFCFRTKISIIVNDNSSIEKSNENDDTSKIYALRPTGCICDSS
jgi:hypothetical protein